MTADDLDIPAAYPVVALQLGLIVRSICIAEDGTGLTRTAIRNQRQWAQRLPKAKQLHWYPRCWAEAAFLVRHHREQIEQLAMQLLDAAEQPSKPSLQPEKGPQHETR